MGWTAVGSLAAILTTLGFVPQVFKMWRTRSAEGVSAITFIQMSLGIFLWMVYGVHLGDPVIVVANAVTLAILGVAIGLYLRLTRGQGSAGRR
jgi:MtN3 and saliva related transmembrane protein